MPLSSFDIDAFLSGYWQKKPLLIRNPWAVWRNPIEPDELAGLACGDTVEARLITQAGKSWVAEHGPFPEARFDVLGPARWTLLVQAVDHHVPEVAALIEPFRFVPNWRIDDVMVSLASDGGGVGPHFDRYDVFLVQGLGKRRWRIGAPCDDASELLPHDDLRLLASFETLNEWILEPGDILYVPPGVAHEGVALGEDCMTYSIGFRAPSRGELIDGWCDDLFAKMTDDDRYGDPDLRAQANPGEIAASAIDRLHAMVTKTMTDRDAFARWFGRYASTPKYPDIDWRPAGPIAIAQVRKRLAEAVPLVRNPASRFCFVRQGADGVLLFVDGECLECETEAAAFAELLCAQARITIDPGLRNMGSVLELIAKLIDRGSVAFDFEE